LGTLLTTHQVTGYTASGGFLKVIPMNYYAGAALRLIIVLALKQVQFGPMKRHEQRAVETGELHNPELREKVDETTKHPERHHSKMRDLITAIVVLFAATILFMIWTGYQGAGADRSLMNIFGEAVIEDSLIYGGLIALLVTFILFFRHMKQGELTISQF